ncbi:hypothetical protein AOLI_G00228010 [Acnodon oligacanthus]
MSLADQSQQWLTARAKVSVLQARGLRIKGKLGTDGAHVLLQVGSQKFSTPKGPQQRADPVWDGQEAAFELAGFPDNSAALRVQVLQRALVGPDKLLGQTDIDLGELYSNRGRDRTEWFKLFGKPGKPEKDRGEILLDIQFLKGSMSASMFDLSSQDKSRSKIGKLKDKLRGKKKEGLSDSASAIIPSVTQVMIDSDGEEEEEPVSGEKKKKNKLKSLFVPKSSLQRNTSQSMSTLSTFPERDSAIASSSSSGLNVESPEGKKKFKLFTHKRNSSTDSKVSQSGFVSKQSVPPMVCINGSHVYSEEPETKGSSLSLTSSGHGSMEELRREKEERERLEEERRKAEREVEEERRKVEEEKERMRMVVEEKWRKTEEERRRKEREEEEQRKIEEEKERMRVEREKEEKRKMEEERRKDREEEEQRRIEEAKERMRVEREKEEQRRKIEEEKRKEREEEEQRKIEEEKERMRVEREKEEQWRKIEEERKRKEREEEEQRKIEEKERMRVEREKEEQRKIEGERKRMERESEQQRKKLEEMERERKRVEEERRLAEEKRRRTEEEERLREEERRRMEMERRLAEEKKVREEEERRRRVAEAEEAEKQRQEAEGKRVREEEDRERKRREEEERRVCEEEERKEKQRLRMEEEKRNMEMKEEEEKWQKKEREMKEAEQEKRPVPKARSGKVSSTSKLEEPREELSFEDMFSTNPFELSFSEEPTSTNPFEEPTDSQPIASVRSARVSTVKPSVSTSGTVSQLSLPNTNPFLDDDDSVDDSLENLSSVGRSTARKKRAPLPPQNKPEMSRPTIPSRDFPLEETKQFTKEVSKRPAPLPPGSLKKTKEEPVKESTVAHGHREKETLAVLENTQTSKVAPISKDELKAWCIQSMKTGQGQNSSQKINPNSSQATTGQTGQNESTKKQADTNPSTCVGTVAARHNKGPAPAKPSAISSQKSLSGDELSSQSTSLTGGTIHPEEKANVSANSESEDNPSKLTAVEGPKSLVAERNKPELADKLPPKDTAAESLQNSYTDSLPRGEEIVEHLSKMNEPESLESEALTGTAKKKSQAPLPPAKPKRIGDPDSPNQQPSLSTTLQANLGHIPESQSNKKDEDKAQDTVSIIYPSVKASSSTFAPLADESEVMRASASVSTGSGLRALPCARVVPTDAQSSAGEVKGAGGAPASVIRQQAVKPLNAADKQSDLGETNGKAAGASDSMQPKKEATEVVGKGPYSQLTQAELISLLLRQQEQLSQRDSRITELEQYIDNLLVRVMEEHPSILMSNSDFKPPVMPSSCPECGSSNVVEDDLYSQKQWVCEDCGSLVSEGVFTTTLSDEQQSRMVPYYVSTEVTKKPCTNLIKGLCRVRALCRILRLSSGMEMGAVSLFERAYNHPTFIHVRLMKKEVLGGCCVLTTCRQNNCPIAMGTISSLLEADSALIGMVYQDLIKALSIEPTTTNISDMLESYCYGYKLSPGEVSEVFAETPRRLVERSTALVELAADTWLVTGRHPLPILMACVYVAWQSLKPMARMKCTLNKFCQISRLSKEACLERKDTVQKRISELRNVLCKLGRELPWLRGDTVEPSTVARLVDDILKHRQALMLKAMRHYEQEAESDLSDCTATNEADQLPITDPAAPSQPLLTSKLDQEDQLSGKDMDILKAPGQSELKCGDKAVGENVLPAGQEHWGKRHLFLPPSVRTEKRPRVDAPELTVTGYEEISDSEIEGYIRSPEEVRRYLAVKRKLKEDED